MKDDWLKVVGEMEEFERQMNEEVIDIDFNIGDRVQVNKEFSRFNKNLGVIVLLKKKTFGVSVYVEIDGDRDGPRVFKPGDLTNV